MQVNQEHKSVCVMSLDGLNLRDLFVISQSEPLIFDTTEIKKRICSLTAIILKQYAPDLALQLHYAFSEVCC